jgi:hypothetical protein
MPEAWDTYDTYATKDFDAVFKDFQNMAEQLEGEDDLPDEDWMARELERGRWAKYVLDKHSSPWDVGNAVRDALARLGVDDVWPEVVGASNSFEPVMPTVDFDTANRRVWNWAKSYEVRTFADENRHPKGGGPDHK